MLTLDYDLVILGDGEVGRYAAALASQWQKRVALVATANSNQEPYPWLWAWQQVMTQQPLGSGSRLTPAVKAQLERRCPSLCAETLCHGGVDYRPLAPYRFQRQPFALQWRNEVLRARYYLLALPALESPPLPPELAQLGLPCHSLMAALMQFPQGWPIAQGVAVYGDTPAAIAIAALGQRLGWSMVLILPGSQLLPQEDLAASRQVQYHLEALGVAIVPLAELAQWQAQQPLPLAWLINGQCLVVPRQTWGTDGLGLHPQPWGLAVDAYLRTAHPRLWACGPGVGGYGDPAIAQFEVDYLLQQWFATSFGSDRRPIDYHGCLWAICRDPTFGRFGPPRCRWQPNWQISQTYAPWTQAAWNSQGKLVAAQSVGSQALDQIWDLMQRSQHSRQPFLGQWRPRNPQASLPLV